MSAPPKHIYRSILDEPCTADHRVGPTVKLRDKQIDRPPRCPDCQDRGMVEVSNQVETRRGHAPIFMPCSTCNPVQARRWREGHLDSRHNRGECRECTAIDQGRVHLMDFDHLGELRPGVLDPT